jgi:hypothetical protein
MPDLANIYRLGIKELWSLGRDPVMLVLIVYCFTLSIYVAATAVPDSLDKVPIAIVDEDASPISARIAAAFYLPRFNPPANISPAAMDAGMDAGNYTFVLDIPPDFQRDVLAGRSPDAGFRGQRVYPANRLGRGQRFCPALPQQRSSAGGLEFARALQPESGTILVRRADRDHQ